MKSIQWRPEVNALTIPQSYWIRFIPRYSAGSADMAARLAKALPNYSEEEFRTFLITRNEILREALLSGEQVTEEGYFTYSLSFTGRLNSPNDPLPPINECLQINVRVSPPFIAAIRQVAHAERLNIEKKLPLINAASDSLLKLKNVLNPEGVLQLLGDNLSFNQETGSVQCVLEGTRNGRVVQSRFLKVESGEILFMPDIPAQTDTWNNEYTVTVSTRYTENGTLRSGTYSWMLRTPLGVHLGSNSGILSGRELTPLVTVSDGVLTSDGARLRIQVIYDVKERDLCFSLLDMKDNSKVGDEVRVAGNGVYTLPGYAGADMSSMEVTVANYTKLQTMVRNSYAGRLVDILDVSGGS